MERVIRADGHHGTSIEIDVSDNHSIVSLSVTNMVGDSASMSMSRQDLEQLATQIRERLSNLAR